MSDAILARSVQPGSPQLTSTKQAAIAILFLWLVAVVLLGASRVFVAPPGTPPPALLFGVLTPISVYFAAYSLSRSFRQWVLTADLRPVVAIQAWRFGGLGFLALYAHNVLPGIFAWPAGLGDMAIGFTAPWVMVALERGARFETSRTFKRWNILGIADLVIAVSIGALVSVLSAGIPGEVSTGPMAELPLVLIPAYLVPVFLMLHATALLQARQSPSTATKIGDV
jgi:hypothetical protein